GFAIDADALVAEGEQARVFQRIHGLSRIERSWSEPPEFRHAVSRIENHGIPRRRCEPLADGALLLAQLGQERTADEHLFSQLREGMARESEGSVLATHAGP